MWTDDGGELTFSARKFVAAQLVRLRLYKAHAVCTYSIKALRHLSITGTASLLILAGIGGQGEKEIAKETAEKHAVARTAGVQDGTTQINHLT